MRSVQADVADAAHTGYENIPGDANDRDDLRWHGCSMTEGKYNVETNVGYSR